MRSNAWKTYWRSTGEMRHGGRSRAYIMYFSLEVLVNGDMPGILNTSGWMNKIKIAARPTENRHRA